jgi:hypothetical protein
MYRTGQLCSLQVVEQCWLTVEEGGRLGAEKEKCALLSLYETDPCSALPQTRSFLKIATLRMLQVQHRNKFYACKRFPRLVLSEIATNREWSG